jgi:hypothetical protein
VINDASNLAPYQRRQRGYGYGDDYHLRHALLQPADSLA